MRSRSPFLPRPGDAYQVLLLRRLGQDRGLQGNLWYVYVVSALRRLYARDVARFGGQGSLWVRPSISACSSYVFVVCALIGIVALDWSVDPAVVRDGLSAELPTLNRTAMPCEWADCRRAVKIIHPDRPDLLPKRVLARQISR